VIDVSFCRAVMLSKNRQKIFYKSCCDWLEARLGDSKFFTIVLGGTAALHTLSGVGGGNFLGEDSAC
jgi:hypothetical protein